MKRARLIYNPSSGREQLRKNLAYILERLEKAGYETSAHATTAEEGCATRAARQAGERGFDLVIAAGGDGTIFEVVNGLAGLEKRPMLGIIPAGTTNDFARALGISRDIEKACDVLCEGHFEPIDIGRMNQKYFTNIAAAGTLTELTYEVPAKLKTIVGQLAYYIKGLEKLPQVKPTFVKVEYDGKQFEDEIMMFLIANTNSVGGFEKLCPAASIQDGLFDFIIVKKTSFPEFVHLASLALRGEHINHPKLMYVKANRIKVSVMGDDEMKLNLDGERGGVLPAEFENLYHHFQMLMPKDRKRN
ncbi:diacylglycerol kinase [Shouchella clausii]|jgi:diacylglycerol kinase (ATP)|uniref:Diacylglycerol kinase n=2 Tax=Shouchella clausii TaxID=79880 RepID=A0A268S608_SHOCL|nr:diacylglycerol kinase [Shouchella clausii]PAD43953.1 diacylglycerol kinase [Bacillus sp. 7520-S]SPT81520.1 lipid kinase [Niallia circulans]AST98493.1 diacylglycerol kinase [Shouchella clausii]MBU8596963.1 diacylglycerol kinase [Shouchella clausii]MCM3548569.1 diacylglycerol kinase [Shouchella clausii]